VRTRGPDITELRKLLIGVRKELGVKDPQTVFSEPLD
jgi:hypothetical protein